MTESAERVGTPCPACSPEFQAPHEVLSSGGGRLTVRCGECGHVHKVEPPDPETTDLDVVVSQRGESFTATTEAPADETLAVGEEFVLDAPEALLAVRITDLQLGPEERVESAPAREVDTVWTRGVDNVSVDVTVHPSDGTHDGTRSVEVAVPGDREFVVGEVEAFGDEEFAVEGLVVREDAAGYPARKLDREGDVVPAKDLRRVYARDRSTDAWSAW